MASNALSTLDDLVRVHRVAMQNPILDPDNVAFAITTEECRRSQIQAFCEAWQEQPWSLSPPLVMPILE